MTIQLTPELEQRLADLASARNQPSNQLASEVLEEYVREVEQLSAELDRAEEEADRIGWLTTEEVFARLHANLKKRHDRRLDP